MLFDFDLDDAAAAIDDDARRETQRRATILHAAAVDVFTCDLAALAWVLRPADLAPLTPAEDHQ